MGRKTKKNKSKNLDNKFVSYKPITPTGKKNETNSFLNSVAGSITFRKIN